MQVAINCSQLFLHLLIFLKLFQLVFSFRGASRLPIYRTQAEMSQRAGGFYLEGTQQKWLSFSRLIHGHKNFRQANTCLGVIRLQL